VRVRFLTCACRHVDQICRKIEYRTWLCLTRAGEWLLYNATGFYVLVLIQSERF